MGEDILSNQNGVRERTTLAYEVAVRSAGGAKSGQRHLFFDREDALALVRDLTEGIVAVRVGLYGRHIGPAEAVPPRGRALMDARARGLDAPTTFDWTRVQKQSDGCWLWTGPLTQMGYGWTRVNGQIVRVHRLTYEMLRTTLSTETVLHHMCGVPACINPDHLTPLTQAEHGQLHEPQRAYCKRGHELSPDNIYVGPHGRSCRRCRKQASDSAERRLQRRAYMRATRASAKAREATS